MTLGLMLLLTALQTGGCILERQPVLGDTLDVTLLETTDIHSNVLGYDYYKTADDPTVGLNRTATLIKAARKEFPNSILVDNGDLIQGTPLADYKARVQPLRDGEIHPVYKAMNYIGYDAGNIGNHEFNYGLDFLARAVSGAAFPYVLANVSRVSDRQPLYPPYVILKRHFNGYGIRIGIIGFTPPAIMQWDKGNLEGRVYAEDIVKTAERYVPEMKTKGADIIVAVAHSGMSTAPYFDKMENAAYYLSKVKGIDAILFGHSHSFFPGKDFARMQDKGIDNVKGTVNGVAAVMPGFWGNALGVVKLKLEYTKNGWAVKDSASELRMIYSRDAQGKIAAVDPDTHIDELVRTEHRQTIDYVNTPVASSDIRISTYFAQAMDSESLQLINAAQTDYVKRQIQGTQYGDLPVLSAAAPFKTNFRGTGYTDIPAGPVAIKHIADLYLYPNTLHAVKVNGAELKAWLEKSAEMFNRIDPVSTADQQLLNAKFPAYNFDVIDGVGYRIDITQPVGSRIVDLRYNGAPVSPTQDFIVATNNYRASGGGKFPGLDGSKTIIASPDTNRDILIAYFARRKTITAADGADRNWSFASVPVAGRILFESGKGVEDILAQQGVKHIVKVADKADGTGTVYQILL